MNPNYTDIFGRLDWLTKKVKQLLYLTKPKYKSYVAILNANDLGNPIVLENTLGEDITWDYQGVGSYIGTVANPTFVEGKLIGFAYGGSDDDYGYISYSIKVQDPGTIQMLDPFANALESIKIRVEIRVYN